MGEIIKISKFKNNLVHFLIINFSSEIFFLTRISEYINWFGRKWLSYERETELYIRCSKKKSIIFPFNFMQK